MEKTKILFCESELREAEVAHKTRICNLTLSLEEEVKRVAKDQDAVRCAEDAIAYYNNSVLTAKKEYLSKQAAILKKYGFEG